MRLEINGSGILVAILFGAIVLLSGGSWPLAVVVGLGIIPLVIAVASVLIWVLELGDTLYGRLGFARRKHQRRLKSDYYRKRADRNRRNRGF